jgi:hypothetical protein
MGRFCGLRRSSALWAWREQVWLFPAWPRHSARRSSTCGRAVALVQAFVRDGKVRGHGVTSRQRWTTLPGVPSLSETTEFKRLDVES